MANPRVVFVSSIHVPFFVLLLVVKKTGCFLLSGTGRVPNIQVTNLGERINNDQSNWHVNCHAIRGNDHGLGPGFCIAGDARKILSLQPGTRKERDVVRKMICIYWHT